ncbi:PREDICTED: uncharacterized protein LOC109462112 isoform X2 [Branchiostoma belcheri]|uniref:Uncharacterized protein LOC109462112 isoform X2 n=1 Tax=Branchiostoma belcheri TaxID=7741 RepID=A0A6P4Y636_BRABE|nr:PREDICTED: uncharacterized protein LOC109462112 isoform X2 [Branchiostoma belcheri]
MAGYTMCWKTEFGVSTTRGLLPKDWLLEGNRLLLGSFSSEDQAAHPGLEVPWVLQREDFSLRTGWLKEVFLAPYLRPQRELFLLWHEAG